MTIFQGIAATTPGGHRPVTQTADYYYYYISIQLPTKLSTDRNRISKCIFALCASN